MSPRRRRSEFAFGSDSFLDVVSNLVGIVLIIIVMVGAHIRELPNLAPLEPLEPPAPPSEPVAIAINLESVEAEIQRYASEASALEHRLLAALQALERIEKERAEAQAEAEKTRGQRAEAARRRGEEEQRLARHRQSVTEAQADMPRLRERLGELQKAVNALEEKPRERRVLRVHLPISRPVDAEEILFECRGGRVTFADLPALLEMVQQELPHRGEELRTRWSVTDKVGPVGAFELRYTLERERGSSLDQLDLPPAEQRQFRYGLGKWELIPVWPVRGDPASDVLKDGSRFRTIVDPLDAEQVVLTFFVYPDSFDLFREIRDYLHGRGFVVAGRPLPAGYPIYGSKNGSISRGQ